MNEIATSSKPFIEQIPKRDRDGIRYLALFDITVVIHWTNDGWRYDVKLK